MVKCVVLNGLIVDHRQNVCIKNYLGEKLPRQFVAISFSFVIFDNFAFIFFQGLICPKTLQTLLHGDEESERNHGDFRKIGQITD